MNRTLVISDIHGCYDELLQLLDQMGYSPGKDTLILLGDLVDRGPKSKDVVEFAMQLMREKNVWGIRGNHDQRFVDVMSGDESAEDEKFFMHGGLQTLESYAPEILDQDQAEQLQLAKPLIRSRYSSHITFLAGLQLYHEDERHIYVHAGINPLYADWKQQPNRDFMYIKDPFIWAKTNIEKKVIFGHTRTIDIHKSPEIWFADDKIGIDGGCAYGHQLNGLLITSDEQYQTFHVKSMKK